MVIADLDNRANIENGGPNIALAPDDGNKQQGQAPLAAEFTTKPRVTSSWPFNQSIVLMIRQKSADLIDVTSVIRAAVAVVIALIGYNLRVFFSPTHQGFLCGDMSIRLPYRESTIDHFLIYIVSILLLIFTVFLGECVINSNEREPRGPFQQYEWKLRRKNVRMCRFTSIWMIGAAVNVFLVNVFKLSVGSLRPHFIDVCLPQDKDIDRTNCSPTHFFDEYICQNSHDDDARLADARLSFYSGHSASTFFFATFLILYINARILPHYRVCIGPFIALYALLVAIASYVAATRIYDHKHHVIDVLFGAMAGTAIAIFMVVLHLDHFCPPISAIPSADADQPDLRSKQSKSGNID